MSEHTQTACAEASTKMALSKKNTTYLGWLAIRPEQLGINDPITHLHQFLDKGDRALTGIQEDIETDIAERLPKTPFVNYVGFEFKGGDFVSLKDEVSMTKMTKTNLQIFKQEAAKDLVLKEELARAELEAQEPQKLTEWFKQAPVGAYLIFESLPIGEQKFAVSRIYQKVSGDLLEGCFVSLYNPSVDMFNGLRQKLATDMVVSRTKLEILQNCYEFYQPSLTLPDEFVEHYVKAYDGLQQSKNGRRSNFGLEQNSAADEQNGLEVVKTQPKLTSIYLDTIRALAASEGVVTPAVMRINQKMGIKYPFANQQPITIDIARGFIREVITGITSVIDKADNQVLAELSSDAAGGGANYAAVSYYGDQARQSGQTYESNGCPTYNRISANITSDFNALNLAFGSHNVDPTLQNFGKPKIDVCRIKNCPSRGDIWWWPNKTLVGGCSICACCHKLIQKGKKPHRVYAETRKK